MGASQKPSGVGAGQDMSRLFNRFRDNFIARFALRCATRDVSMAVMGNESYGEGYDASGLPLGDEFKGIGILYGLTDDAPTVRTFLADGEDAEVICLAARKLREKNRTLSGDALGVEVEEPESDIIADLLGGHRRRPRHVVGGGGRAARRGVPHAARGRHGRVRERRRAGTGRADRGREGWRQGPEGLTARRAWKAERKPR